MYGIWNIDIFLQGGTGSYNTGPKADHTTNSAEGFYIFTEASYPRRQVPRSRLI